MIKEAKPPITPISANKIISDCCSLVLAEVVGVLISRVFGCLPV